MMVPKTKIKVKVQCSVLWVNVENMESSTKPADATIPAINEMMSATKRLDLIGVVAVLPETTKRSKVRTKSAAVTADPTMKMAL